jgi:hypothetical protein
MHLLLNFPDSYNFRFGPEKQYFYNKIFKMIKPSGSDQNLLIWNLNNLKKNKIWRKNVKR